MAFHEEHARRTLVEIVDVLNGGTVVGRGFRLPGDVIATSCRCLPRPRGEVVLPDPDQPGVLVLVRVRVPGTDRAAFAIVTAADPRSGLALLRTASAAGLTVPDELNAVVPIGVLMAERDQAVPALAPRPGAPVLVLAADGAWVTATAAASMIRLDDGERRIDPGALGAPIFDEEGRVTGLVTATDPTGREATMCSLADHLPGWALRQAPAASVALGRGAMAFDRERAEGSVVDVLWGVEGDRVMGMGFRLLPGVIATACRCLPHGQGKVRLPSADDPAADPLLVRVRHPRTGAVAAAAVVAADPCADFALLAAPAHGASPSEPTSTLPGFGSIVASLQPTLLEWTPGWEGPAFVFTDERRWVDGACGGSRFSPRIPGRRLRTRTSGAPVFNVHGRVVGLVGHNDVRQPEAALCALADQLPGWALREARAGEANGEER